MARVLAVKTNLFKLPLDEVLVDVKYGEYTHFALITGTVELENGLFGTGYTYAGGQGGVAIDPDKTGIGVDFDWNKLREFSECTFLK